MIRAASSRTTDRQTGQERTGQTQRQRYRDTDRQTGRQRSSPTPPCAPQAFKSLACAARAVDLVRTIVRMTAGQTPQSNVAKRKNLI